MSISSLKCERDKLVIKMIPVLTSKNPICALCDHKWLGWVISVPYQQAIGLL